MTWSVRILAALAAMAAWISAGRAGEAKPRFPADSAEYFESRVRPVLSAHCFGCHGPQKQKGGLRLDSLASMLSGGESGPAIQPGHPDTSLLVDAIRYGETRQMPPKGKLSEDEIAVLTEWIKRGAPWPDHDRAPRPVAVVAGPKVSAEDRAFWAFQPIRDPAPPAVNDSTWPASPIDRFVLAKLEEAGLRPVEPADKRALIRRATFDLIGLPPTPEEIDAFLADESPEAFARVVDRLLASPHYGERWGRHWLDIARYGEDQAHTFQSRKYPYGFRYRDWVIKALNDDMPYDRFLLEQIAGDLLHGSDQDGQLAALGFFALGPVYYGKAVDDELDDRVDTLCRGLLGLTVACARCHDHKFDPIPTEDYYALAGIFASTEYKEYPRAPREQVERYDSAQAAIGAKTRDVNRFLAAEGARLAEARLAETSHYMVAAWMLTQRRMTLPSLSTAEFARVESLEQNVLDRWVRYLFSEKPAATVHLDAWRRLLAGQDKTRDLSASAPAKGEVTAAADAFQRYVTSLVRLRNAIEEHRAAASAIGDSSPASAGAELADTEAALLRNLAGDGGLFAVPRDQVESRLSAEAKAKLKTLRAELDRLKKELPPKYAVIHSLTESPSPANMRVHIRGNAESLGAEVPRRFLTVLSSDPPQPFSRGSGRLELAQAIASKDNPLTARVVVNRIWEHHMGRGLVGTPSNFGELGERPSHPELLDYLASRFIAGGWSIKAMHRQIMLSATYQLSATYEAKNFEVDPDNRLLWRMNRRRLEVEAWRDAMLAVSGQLDRTLGGPSVDLKSPENRRRTVYAAISRHDLDSLLRLFDFPDPNITSDKRTVTSVPQQQLFVLNSEFIVRQAKALAARLAGEAGESDPDRIRRAYLLVYGRPASEQEVLWGLAFLADKDAAETSAPPAGSQPLARWEQYAQVLLGSNEFAFLD